MPVTLACLPGTVRAPLSSRASARYRMSLTSVDLPDPDTPVTATNRPSGNATSTSAQVVRARAVTTTCGPWSRCRRLAGTGIDFRPAR